MTSKLVKKGEIYICSNCMMRQPRVQSNCFWCGSFFYNYEDMIRQEFQEKAQEALKDESSFYGRD